MSVPRRGEVWTVDLDPVRGHEQAGRRPALILSADLFNSGPADLLVILPLTTKSKGVPFHVLVEPPEGGLKSRSFIKCEDIRSVAKERIGRHWGLLSDATLAEVEDRIMILLNL